MTERSGWRLVLRVLVKAGLLFVFLNLLFAVIYPRDLLGSLSGYNWLFPGRVRLPHSDVPEKAFNLTTANLAAMFRSHELSDPSNRSDFRIAIIGDSSVWGFLLSPDQTFSSQLERQGLVAPDGRAVRVFNLGYPTLSLTKDLMLLDQAMKYDPDMIIWFVTLESVIKSAQIESPLLELNPGRTYELVHRYGLSINGLDQKLETPTFLERTIVGSRVELSELIRLQLYGFTWAATGVDHYIPDSYNQRSEDLSAELDYRGLSPNELDEEDLFFEAIDAGDSASGEIPFLVVNEPIFLSPGENSDVRYNFFYPRWAYDRYREMLGLRSGRSGWQLFDLWDAIPPSEFTDSAIHYSRRGSEIMAETLASILENDFGFVRPLD